jgi:uncharacterized protein (TIGR02996 family)
MMGFQPLCRATTMTDEKCLLATIWEEPHEDAPRLVYADWLEDHDRSARAEFIRVQCQLALLEEEDETPQRSELLARESQPSLRRSARPQRRR